MVFPRMSIPDDFFEENEAYIKAKHEIERIEKEDPKYYQENKEWMMTFLHELSDDYDLYAEVQKELDAAQKNSLRKELQDIVEELNDKNRIDIELYDKEDIIKIFKCENEKALKILRVAFDMQYATRIGKEYYIEKTKLDEFMNDVRGRKVVL